MTRRSLDPAAAAAAYAELFPSVYRHFHRRDEKRSELTSASRAVLMHLAQSGPLTIGDCAAHLDRAQSVVSEIVDQLEGHGLLARVRDEADRRRVLVWLTDAGRARMIEDQEVLSRATLAQVLERMDARDREKLIEGTRALLRATATPTTKPLPRRKR